jgi:ERCC4-related helicase
LRQLQLWARRAGRIGVFCAVSKELTLQESRTALVAGESIELRDTVWSILDVEHFGDVTLLTLRGSSVENLGRSQGFLLPFDRIQRRSGRTRMARVRRQEVLQIASWLVARCAPWDECRTAAPAKIDLRTWQLEPARAAVLGATRLLLADEAGLGKTIQAGLIVTELLVRGLAQRVLVLSPASLRSQWAAELTAKFGLTVAIFDQTTIAELSSQLPLDANPWTTAQLIVSSIDLVKRPEVRVALDEVPFDVLVIDEAHHLTPGTDRAALVADLARRTPWVVLATATPHTGDDAAYRLLRSLGSNGPEEPLSIFRRCAADVRDRLPRRELWLGVRPTNAERLLLDATADYYRALQRSANGHAAVLLVGSVIARRASSMAAAACSTLERRLSLLKGAKPQIQELLPWDEADESDALSDHTLQVQGLPDAGREIVWLERLVALARAASADSSKLRALERLVRRSREPLIVFSEYRDVVAEIAHRLSELASVVVIHGGVSASGRRDRIEAFTRGTASVLLTTDAAGEGLNLQSRCRLIVNLELPWSPQRIEQRIGRVDRIGQSHRVHAIHLYHRASFENIVRQNLERRRTLAAATVISDASSPLVPFAITARRLLTYGAGANPSSTLTPFSTETRPESRPQRLCLLFVGACVDAGGRLVQTNCVGVRLELSIATATLTKRGLEALSSHPNVRERLTQVLDRQIDAARLMAATTADALERRIRSILASIDGQADPLFQGSLFDRRAEQRARARKERTVLVRAQLMRRLEIAHALRDIRSTVPRLAAAWIGR